MEELLLQQHVRRQSRVAQLRSVKSKYLWSKYLWYTDARVEAMGENVKERKVR
jgi:hypothetical protein